MRRRRGAGEPPPAAAVPEAPALVERRARDLVRESRDAAARPPSPAPPPDPPPPPGAAPELPEATGDGFFWFDGNGDRRGPSSLEDLEAAFSRGRLGVNSLVYDGDLVEAWTPLRDVPHLRRRLEPDDDGGDADADAEVEGWGDYWS